MANFRPLYLDTSSGIGTRLSPTDGVDAGAQLFLTAPTPGASVLIMDGRDNAGLPVFGIRVADQSFASIYMGDVAGQNVTTGSANFIAGNSAGGALTSGSNNMILGSFAGQLLTVGNRNVLIGGTAGQNLVSGSENFCLGDRAGEGLTDGSDSVFIGARSGLAGGSQHDNVMIGKETGRDMSNVGSRFNIGIGNTVLTSAGLVERCVGIGHEALREVTTGPRNIGIGHRTGLGLTTGAGNTFIANVAGELCGPAASDNTGIGGGALRNVTGSRNIAIGGGAADDITAGDDNVFIGWFSGLNVSQKVDAVNSIAIGRDTFTTADNQVVIGNTSVTETTLRGEVVITTAAAHPASVLEIQDNAGVAAFNVRVTAAADSNILIGDVAGQSLTTGTQNTIFGTNAGGAITSGVRNFLLGDSAGAALTTGSNNVLVGVDAGLTLTTGANNFLFGRGAGDNLPVGSRFNTTLGNFTLTNSDGINVMDENLAIGYSAGRSLSEGLSNTFIGHQSGFNASQKVDPTNTVAIGADSFTTKDNQAVIGADTITETLLRGEVVVTTTDPGPTSVMEFQDSAGLNVFNIRITASADNNVMFGDVAGESLTTGTGNTIFGNISGGNITSGIQNTLLGGATGTAITSGNRNTIAGVAAGDAITTGDDNSCFGFGAGTEITVGSGNTCGGNLSGVFIVTGSNNTFLGNNAGNNASQKTDATNSMALGNGAFTTANNQIVLGNTSVTNTVLRGTVEVRNGVIDQSVLIYNTFTSSTNFEALGIVWASDLVSIVTIKGSAGGSARSLFLGTDSIAAIQIDENQQIIMALASLPTADPVNAGQLWRDGTDLKVSLG